MRDNLQLIIGGDLVPTKTNFELFKNGEVEQLIGKELLDILLSADYRIFNLETPLTDIKSTIPKCGPNLSASLDTVNGLKMLNPSLLGLANNHIMDQGYQGLASTFAILEKNNIDYVGAGKNLQDAEKGFILENETLKIGVYNCAEKEFSIASKNCPGANPFDPFESLEHIENLSEKCDYTIVLYHGGKEHYRYPSPYLQKVCHKMVEKGANFIVCQHSHCIGCEEKYKNATIVYGQGNFIFDYSNSKYWETSLLIKLDLSIDSKVIEYIPFVKQNNVIRLAKGKNAKRILENFKLRSESILDENFLINKYNDLAKLEFDNYITHLNGDNFFIRGLNKIFGHHLIKHFYSEKALLVLRNYIECEAHRELILCGIKQRLAIDKSIKK